MVNCKVLIENHGEASGIFSIIDFSFHQKLTRKSVVGGG